MRPAKLLESRGRVPYDLIVADIRMPGVAGTSILAWVARSEYAPPFILMTAFGDEQTHALARRLGAVALLDKPFELEALHEHVQTVLQGDRATSDGVS